MADKLLKSIKFPTLPDRYVIGDPTLTEEGAAAEAKAVGEALAKKADTKGTYEDLIVGGAEQLVSDEYETDKEPYLFRPTGGSADVGNREYLDKIVGGTVAWNQLAPVYSKTGSGGSAVTAGTPIVKGHKYLIGFKRSSNTERTSIAVFTREDGANKMMEFSLQAGGETRGASIRTAPASGVSNGTNSNVDGNVWLWQTSSSTSVVTELQIIDLTAMFNPTIADYIYSLEQSQAGAGVAWFRQYFPKDYYPYDPGTLRSVEGVSAHETVGKNLLEPKLYNGGVYNPSIGTKWNLSASENQFERLSDDSYSITFPSSWTQRVMLAKIPSDAPSVYVSLKRTSSGTAGISIGLLDEEYTVLSAVNNTDASQTYGGAFTLPIGARYLYIVITNRGGSNVTITITEPQVEIGTTATTYEPYTKHTYPLDSSLTLRGVPKLVDGKLSFDGDVYPPSGEVQRRYGIVDLGTLDWSYSGGFFRTSGLNGLVKRPAKNTEKVTAISDGYEVMTWNSITNTSNKSFAVSSGSDNAIFCNTAYTDAASFKAAMSGVYLVYEKATPTTETADDYEQYQICDPSGTEEFVTTGIVPVGHETRYPHDLKKKIETAPDSPSTDGTYLMKRSGGKNAYMALPSTPSANGSYVLTVTVSGGTASYSWTAKE